MKLGRTVWVIPFLLMALPLAAQWRENEQVVPDKPWAKTSGDFGASLTFTDKPDELFASWETESAGVSFSETTIAVRGSPIVGIIFFSACATNELGQCDVVVRFTTTAPDGRPWGKPIDADLWVGRMPPHRNALQLAHGNLGIIINADDPLGVYTVEAMVTDRVSNRTVTLERHFTAFETPTE